MLYRNLYKSTRLITLFIFLTIIFSTSQADYIAGEKANSKGDRVTAFKEFHAAALNKDKRAYGKLGSMYLYGLGTTKDYQQAYVWFELAHLSGEKEGERFRNAASSMLSRDEYLMAKALAETQRKNFNINKVPPQ